MSDEQRPKTIKELIAASSIGQGLKNIRRNGLAAELREVLTPQQRAFFERADRRRVLRKH